MQAVLVANRNMMGKRRTPFNRKLAELGTNGDSLGLQRNKIIRGLSRVSDLKTVWTRAP